MSAFSQNLNLLEKYTLILELMKQFVKTYLNILLDAISRVSIDTIRSPSGGVRMQDCEAWARVEDVLEKLGAPEGDGALLAVRDDTLLLKLHSHLHTFLLHAKEGGEDVMPM